MFFLDTVYLNTYLAKRSIPPHFNDTSLQVWIHNSQTSIEYQSTEKKDIFCSWGINGPIYKLLIKGRDYSIDNRFPGTIRFDSTNIFEEDRIGICITIFDSNGNVIIKGDTSNSTTFNSCIVKKSLWILKDSNPLSTDSCFSLMWRNVYTLPIDAGFSKFRLNVLRTPETGDTCDRVGVNLLSAILGLTDSNGEAKISASSIFDFKNKLLIIPPFVENDTLNNKPFENPALGIGNTNPEIYQYTQDMFLETKHKFAIIFEDCR